MYMSFEPHRFDLTFFFFWPLLGTSIFLPPLSSETIALQSRTGKQGIHNLLPF